jgi:NAD(P)-dependent dehydrogenase (short-subunit alcohol dehydrogenase family)
VQIAGNVALVTGGGSGLGRATAEALAAAGARVVIVDLPTSDGKQVAADIGVFLLPGDVTSENDITAAIDSAAQLGPLRIAVNCAGVADAARVLGKHGPFPLATFRKVVEVNLIGTFNVVRLAAERISSADELDGERGVIISTSSVAAFERQIGQAAYSASKGGVAALTLPVARELAATKIRVVTIAPGLFETPMLAGLPEDAKASLGAQVPHPARLGRPSEYAALVEHIVRNPMLNGEVIRLDGAIRMAAR